MDYLGLALDVLLKSCRSLLLIDTSSYRVYPQKFEGKVLDDKNYHMDMYSFLESYISSCDIHPDDLWQFELLKDLNALKNYYFNDERGSVMSFRRVIDGHYVWFRMETFFPPDYSDENPYAIILCHLASHQESNYYDIYTSFTEKMHKVMKVNLTKYTYAIIKEYPTEQKIREKRLREYALSSEAFINDGYVHPEDVEPFTKHVNPDYVKDYFSHGNTDYSFFYRRKVGTLFRWVKLSIIPTSEYSETNLSFFYIIEDVHKEMLKILDLSFAASYARYFAKQKLTLDDNYYENILSVLHGLTQSYLDFFMLHLEKDLYVSYKIKSGLVNKGIPPVGSFSKTAALLTEQFMSPEQAEAVKAYSTPEKVREQFMDKLTIEYEFTALDGRRVKTIMQKIESSHGIPTKILCRTILCSENTLMKVRTFGNFEVYDKEGKPVHFSRKQSKQLFAYLIDRQGYPVTSKDIVIDVLEKDESDMNAVKYVSTVIRRMLNDLAAAGFPNIIIKEQKTIRVDTNAVDCDYYHLLHGNYSYLLDYHNEYMKEYSWAESTNAEILSLVDFS